MHGQVEALRLRFGIFEFRALEPELRRQGVRLKLQEQPLRVLGLLLEHVELHDPHALGPVEEPVVGRGRPVVRGGRLASRPVRSSGSHTRDRPQTRVRRRCRSRDLIGRTGDSWSRVVPLGITE